MATFDTPILGYQPGGGVSAPGPPPLFPSDVTDAEGGITQLVSGQSYIDVTFVTPKPSTAWEFTDLQVVNTTDASPLNIWPGVLTIKTTTGFRLQLNGLPNSSNYYLHWTVGGLGTADWVLTPGTTSFLALSDAPDSYAGQAGKAVKVNLGETALEFGIVSGGGGGTVINVLDYGAVADCVTLFDITMPNGNVVTSPGHTFVSADIGKWAIIRGATDGGGVSPLVAQITAVSGHSVTLSAATTTALTNLQPDSFPRMDFGTDNTWPFDLACLAVPGPGHRNFYSSIPFAAAGTMNPILPGDGGTVYIPRGNYLMVPCYPSIPGTTFWWCEANNVTIKGDGMGASVIYSTSAVNAPFSGGGFAHSNGMFQNITLSDFTIYDLNYYNGAGNTINIEQSNNVLIERIETVNGKGNACINYQGYNTGGLPVNRRLYIRDCWIHGDVTGGSSNIIFTGIQGDGMNVGQVADVHIENNTIDTPGRHGYEGGGNCMDQYFIGNTVNMANSAGTTGGNSGLNPTGGSTTVLIGNTVKGVSGGNYGIDFTVDVGPWVANDIRVIGNYVQGNMQAAFRFQNTSGTPATSHVDRIIVANNWIQPGTNINTAGVLIGGSGGTGQSFQMLIVGNWFNNTGFAFTAVDYLGTATGEWVVMRNNVFASSTGIPVDDLSIAGNIIIENNTLLGAAGNRYGGKGMSCNIDGNNVLAGAIFSATAGGIGYRTTDSVEIVRGATTAGSLIIWGQVTAANTITTYAYNPTAGTLNTGATTTYIVHRPLP